MATPDFLSIPLASGFARESLDLADTFETDSGHVRRRSKYVAAPEMVTCSWLLTQAKFDEFDAWFEDELNAGAMAFSWTLLGATQPAMFSEPYSVEVDERMLYRVSAKVLLGAGVIGSDDPDPLSGLVSIGTPVAPVYPFQGGAPSISYSLPGSVQLVYAFDTSAAIFSSELAPNSVPDPADFVLTIDGVPATINAVSINAASPAAVLYYTVTLSSSDVAAAGQEVRLSYTPGATPLMDRMGRLASRFVSVLISPSP